MFLDRKRLLRKHDQFSCRVSTKNLRPCNMANVVHTNEGRGEDDELMEWMIQNNLMMAKTKLLEHDISMTELRELADAEIHELQL